MVEDSEKTIDGEEQSSFMTTTDWNQKSIDKALANYHSESVKDLMLEDIWSLIRKEIYRNLKIHFNDEISLDDAEFIAFKELKRRLEKGSIKYLSKTYVGFIAKSAIQYVCNRRKRLVSFDLEKGSGQILRSKNSPPDQRRFIKYADLYICLEKLPHKEMQVIKLHHFNNFKLEDVASELGIEHQTARKRHSRILEELRKCLERQKRNN